MTDHEESLQHSTDISTTEYFPLVTNDGDEEDVMILSPVPFRERSSSEHHLTLHQEGDDGEEAGGSSDGSTQVSLLRRRQPNVRPRLNGLNVLNVLTYAAHLFVSWGIGVYGLGGVVETRWHITLQYETLVTPAKWAYYLWAPILVLEGLFALAQLLPKYRARPIVQAGTGFYFFYTFLLQTIWTLFFSFRFFTLSFVSVVAGLLSLVALLVSQQKAALDHHRSTCHRWMEYMLFCFPFVLHTGWMVFMTVDHFSILFRAYGAGTGMEVTADIVALAVMLPVATLCLVSPASSFWRGDLVIPFVILYAYVSIGCRLLYPSECMLERYGFAIVQAIRGAAFFCAGIVLILIVPNLVIWFSHVFCTINVIELDGL